MTMDFLVQRPHHGFLKPVDPAVLVQTGKRPSASWVRGAETRGRGSPGCHPLFFLALSSEHPSACEGGQVLFRAWFKEKAAAHRGFSSLSSAWDPSRLWLSADGSEETAVATLSCVPFRKGYPTLWLVKLKGILC